MSFDVDDDFGKQVIHSVVAYTGIPGRISYREESAWGKLSIIAG